MAIVPSSRTLGSCFAHHRIQPSSKRYRSLAVPWSGT